MGANLLFFFFYRYCFRINVRVKARVTVWVQFKVGVWARIAFFLFARWRANELYLFQMIGFYGFLDGNKARTEVLPLAIPRARPIYRAVDTYWFSAIMFIL